MKQSTSIHIAEDIMKEIDEYKNKYNISRSAAIERMLLERRFFMQYNVSGKNTNDETNNSNSARASVEDEVAPKKESKISESMRKSIFNTFGSIPDAPDN